MKFFAKHKVDVSFCWQNGLDTKVEKSRKQLKERKNRAKKIRGVKKVGCVAPMVPSHHFFLIYFPQMF